MLKKYLHYILSISIALPLYLIYFISGFIPRNSNLWLFGSWEGKYFRGNSKDFFLYVQNNDSTIKCAWITKSFSLYKQLKGKGIKVYYAYSPSGMVNNALAKYIFVTHGIHDVNEYFTRNSVVIDFSHATCPIKKMGYASEDEYFKPTSILKKLFNLIVNPYGYVKPSYLITSSEYTAVFARSTYEIDDSRIIKLGLPKTDKLLNNNSAIESKVRSTINRLTGNINYNNIILFLPTYRRNSDFDLFNFDFNLEQLEDFLNKNNLLFLLNLHPFDKDRFENFSEENCKRIILLNLVGDELNLILRKVSIFITDYSSLWSDYLIYNSPIIFAQFDHDKYLTERKVYDHQNNLPGHIVKNWPELIGEMNNIVINGNDVFKQKRLEMKKSIYKYSDGESCSRIYDFVNELQKLSK